ncbi:MAG: AraC family transcriptional regulator [Ruminococcaceae bacterium]|nr:AraC family transcriptional regulator [Oscillospiraceae bacterium]
MNVSDFVKKLDLAVLTETDLDRPVNGCYIGDLLSWVMGRATSGDIWITIMNNINIVAVASLTDCACILLCEGVNVEKEIINKANSQDIIILQSDKTAYELAKLISEDI